MTNAKSIALAFQDAGWLIVIVLICAITIAASSMFVSPRLRFLRKIASRAL